MVVTSSEPGNLPEHDTWRGARVERMPMHSPLYRNDVRAVARVRTRLAALKREFGPDVVHVHLADAAVLFHMLTEAETPAPVVVTVHSALAAAQAAPQTVLQRAITAAAWVTGCSRSMLDQTLHTVPEVASRSSVILNGMDTDRIAATPAPSGPPSVLLLGRLVEEKGFDVGLRACALVHQSRPDLRVRLVGDGPERDRLLSLVVELGLEGAVEHTGRIPMGDVPSMLSRSNVVVIPSRYDEPFGLVAVEAGLAGRPVIASARGGLPEVVVDGVNGLLVPDDDPRALANALLRVLADPALAADFGRAGRVRAEHEFSLERHVNAFEDLYDRLLRS